MFDVINNAQQSRVDKLQLSAIAFLMLIGVAFVYSATMIGESAIALPVYDQLWFRQIIWYGLGIGVATAMCFVDYRSLSRFSFIIYWVTILLLIAVLIPGVGSVHVGARRWIDLKVFQLQPSEFAKLAFILAQAHFLSRPPEELKLPGNFWKAIGLMMLPFVLIMKEPDLGSALVLVPTGLAMMFVAGTPRKYLFQLCGAVGFWGYCWWQTCCSRRRICGFRSRNTSGNGCWFISGRVFPTSDASDEREGRRPRICRTKNPTRCGRR